MEGEKMVQFFFLDYFLGKKNKRLQFLKAWTEI